MTITQFINKTDALGGLLEMYKNGYVPDDLDVEEDPSFYGILLDAWNALDKFFEMEDDYYTYCEECGQEQ